MSILKKGLEPPPPRIAALPIDDRGYPVPWFVAWVDGRPEFRMSDPLKYKQAIVFNKCWVCGQNLGAHKVFVIGPMCGINRITSEPPCHLDCAEWSARNCPFLSNPEMVRREKGMPEAAPPPGIMLKRNPGVTLLWTTKTYKLVPDGRGGRLISIGEPESIKWYARGQVASPEQVLEAIHLGYPFIEAEALVDGPDAVAELSRARANLERMITHSQNRFG